MWKIKENKMSINQQFWSMFLTWMLVVCLLTIVIGGCEKQDQGDINKKYDGTKMTVIDNSIYKYKVTVKFAGSISAVKYYCERLQTPAVHEWIILVGCKNFNGDLYIPYNQMKWFTYADYNGEDE
jgi:hypothetical protein